VPDLHADNPAASGVGEVQITGAQSVRCKLEYVYLERLQDHHALYVGAAILGIPVVRAAEPGVLPPTVYAPFKSISNSSTQSLE